MTTGPGAEAVLVVNAGIVALDTGDRDEASWSPPDDEAVVAEDETR